MKPVTLNPLMIRPFHKPIARLLHVANQGGRYASKNYHFYPLKNQLLPLLGQADGWDKQIIIKPCWHCDKWEEWGELPCPSCGGTGIYSRDTYHLERWKVKERVYHIPYYPYEKSFSDPPKNMIEGQITHSDFSEKEAERALWLLLLICQPGVLVSGIFRSYKSRIYFWLRKQILRIKIRIFHSIKDVRNEMDIPF